MRYIYTKRGKYIFGTVGLLTWCNMLVAAILYYVLGGQAYDGGYIKDGNCYLYHKGFGFHEVACAIWQWSYWQGISAFVLLCLTGLIGAILLKTGDMK